VSIVIQQQMKLDRSLGLAELGPREQTETQIDRAGVQTEQLVLEPELGLLARILGSADVQQISEQRSVQFPRTMGVRVSQRALRRCAAHPEMVELTAGHPKAVTDLAQAPRLSKLTEKHRYELVPARKTLTVALCLGFTNSTRERTGWNNT